MFVWTKFTFKRDVENNKVKLGTKHCNERTEITTKQKTKQKQNKTNKTKTITQKKNETKPKKKQKQKRQ